MRKVGILAACIVVGFSIPILAYSAQNGRDGVGTAPEDSLTLDQCIAIALKNSHKVAITKGNISKARINLKDARSGFLPEIYLYGGYNLNDAYSRFEWNEKYYNLSISASTTPFASGKKLINVAKSKASLSSAQEGYRLTKASLALDVTKRYYSLLEASELLGLKKQSLAQKRIHLEFAKTQYGLGLVPRADVLKAEVDVISAQVDSLQAAGNLRVAKAELNDAMGISLDCPIKIRSVKSAKEAPPDLDTCLSQALTHRPELTQQELNLSIMRGNLRLAKIERLPTLIITGAYEVYADRFVFGGVPLNQRNWDKNTDWRVGIGLSFPIFDGGVKWRAIEAAKININEAELNYEELEKEVKLEVKSAHLNLVTALKKIELTEKQVKSAEESYDAALGRYKTGVAPITEVIDAEVVLANSRVNHISAVYDYFLAKATLEKAIGQLPFR